MLPLTGLTMIKSCIKRLGSIVGIGKKRTDTLCTNVLSTSNSKNCLILYITAPFVGPERSKEHQNYSQLLELADIVASYGYNVDVVDYNAKSVNFRIMYDLIIDIHPQRETVYGEVLSENALKIGYLTGSNPSFANAAEQKRLDDLFQRRGRRLAARRQVPPFEKDVIDRFDAFFFIGNAYNLATYKEFEFRRVCLIRNNGYDLASMSSNSGRSSKNFVFLASSGQVHKGLDLLLEIFSRNCDLKLYV